MLQVGVGECGRGCGVGGELEGWIVLTVYFYRLVLICLFIGLRVPVYLL